MRLRALLIVLACALAYANAPAGSFHFDDAHAVVENPSIRSLANFGRFFVDPGAFSVLPQNQGYRPLLLVTYALTAQFTGVNSHAFIAVNLLVHILCALLVWITVGRSLRHIGRSENADDVAFVTALIFGVHPLFSECVNYVSARSESLSAALTLAALYGYLRARQQPRWLLLTLPAIAGALVTKPVATIFPLMLIVFEAAAVERQPLRRIAPRFLAVTAVVIALGILSARMTPAIALRAASSFTRGQYLRSELPAIWHYVRLFLLPYGQCADADYPLADSFRQPHVIAAGLALAVAIALSIWAISRRRYSGAGLAVLWFVMCIFPSSSIFPLAEIVNEHRPYLAAASLCALAAAALLDGVPRGLKLSGAQAREASFTIVALLLLALGVLTAMRNRVWRTEETLWADVVAKAPGSTRGQMNYGLSLMGSGQIAEAEIHLREAVRLAPYYSYAHVNLGNLLLYQNKLTEALPHFELALVYDPNLFWAHYYRGLAAERMNEPAPARIKFFAAATQLSPNFPDAWYHLAISLDAAGNFVDAMNATRRAVALRGAFDDRFMLAFLLLKQNDLAGAKPLLQQLHAEHPDDQRITLDLDLLEKASHH